MGKLAPAIVDRPHCPACDKALRPTINTTWERVPGPGPGGFSYKAADKRWTGAYGGYGAFCSLSCCQAYANAMFTRHGTRFVLAK